MKKYLLLLLFLGSLCASFAIEGSPIPPKNEDTEDFFFKKFVRQPNLPKFIEAGIETLGNKNASLWDGADSLYFALQLTLIQDYEHALNYYVKLKLDTITTPHTLHLIQLTSRKTQRFQRLLDLLAQEYQGDKNNYVYRFRKRMAEVRLYIRDRGNILDETILFSELQPEYVAEKSREELIEMTKALDDALRIEILYCDDSDRLISKAYEEFGDFLLEHFYITNAFIAYHIARYFSQRSNSAQKKVKSTRELLHEKNLLLPSFSRTFAKIKNDRYSFAVIVPPDSIDLLVKDGSRFLDLDELLARNPPREDRLPWLDGELVVVFVLFLALLFAVFVIKAKGRRK